MRLLIPSLMTNEGDQQIIIHVAIHENACFSKRAAHTLLISTSLKNTSCATDEIGRHFRAQVTRSHNDRH